MSVDLARWLDGVGLGEYLDAFELHRVRFDDLANLTAEDLREIGLPVGPRRRFLGAAAALSEHVTSPTDVHGEQAARDTPEEATDEVAERRRMSVVFCDLVGSTALSDRLEVEDLRDVIRDYQERVTQVIVEHGGHVAKYLGDGVLAYFGWPAATEDQTVSSVRAALEIVSVVPDIDVSGAGLAPLQSRVGIATGSVVIGDLSGERDAIVGRTPNLAARLEGVASPGHVVIDEATAGLVAHEFELTPPSAKELKGIDGPVATFGVVGHRSTSSRFDAVHDQGRLSSFVGRRAELGLLTQAWEHAATGDGGLVVIGGEAGIGKSRLVHELIRSIDREHELWHFQCSPAHASSVLHPVLRRIELAAGLRLGGDEGVQLDRLRDHLAGWAPDDLDATVALVAGYLGLIDPGHAGVHRDPAQRKAAMLHLLTSRLDDARLDRPFMAVFEDLHWADPTTLDLVRRLSSRLAERPVLVVATHRPEFELAMLGADRLTSLHLDRLPSGDVRELARAILGDALDDRTAAEIVNRTDGNPLYIEEFAPLAGDLAAEGSGQVPASLSASLVAQLDRLGASKRTAQVASVIGRDFSPWLLDAVLDTPDAADPLGPMLTAGIVVPSAYVPGEFAFKHALVRDAAYETLLLSDRRTLHARIADVMSNLGSALDTEPEVIAQHFAAAHTWLRAAELWHAAGRRATAAGASEEAKTHLDAALDAVERADPGPERATVELGILLDLAPVSMTVRSFAANEPKQLYERAFDLATQVGDDDQRFIALWGAYFITEIQAQWKQSAENVERLLEIDTATLRDDLPIQIDHAAMTWAHSIGDTRTGLRHNQRVIDAYDRHLHANHRFLFGAHDPYVCAHGQRATGWVAAGRPDDAVESARTGVELARELDHPPTTALALWFFANALHDLDALDDARAAIAETISYCEQHGAGAIRRSVEIRRLATLEDRDEAYRLLRARVDPLRERGRDGFLVPLFATFAAEAAIDVGEFEYALTTLEYAERSAIRTGELFNLGQIHHQRGRAYTAGGDVDLDRAIDSYRAGLDFCTQHAHHWTGVLNATALAGLLTRRGDTTLARETLAGALLAVPEATGRQRVRDAQRLLADLP